MIDQEITARHAALCARIEALNHAYYVLNRPEVDDREYDALARELAELEARFPGLVTPASPTQRVGAPVPESGRFEKVTRAVPMLSLDNSYNPADVAKFEGSVRQFLRPTDQEGDFFQGELTFILEPKIDGISIECVYERGRLRQATTRGDGVTGEDVTVNVRAIGRVPATLAEPLDLTVRGELFLRFADFEAINLRRKEEGLEPLVNPRNAVGGAIHQLELRKKEVRAARQLGLFDLEEPAAESENPISALNISAFFYEIVGEGIRPTQHENLAFLGSLGFQVPPQVEVVESVEGVLAALTRWETARAALDFPMDGLVVKVDRTDLWRLLGRSAKSPRWAIAYKFAAERAVTRLVGVDAQVGRSGIVTPVANVTPVFLAGTTVSRASLHNWAFLRIRKLRIGDWVYVEKAGEIIPQITGIDGTRERGIQIVTAPVACPSCGAELRKESQEIKNKKKFQELIEALRTHFPSVPEDDGPDELEEALNRKVLPDAFLSCPDEEGCPAQIAERLVHFVSRQAMDIDQLGDKIVELLVKAGLVRAPADLYRLREDQLLALEGFAGKSAAQLVAAIGRSRRTSLARLVTAVGIAGVGAVNARLLAAHFGTFDRLVGFARAPLAEREAEAGRIPGLGEKLAGELSAYFERRWVVDQLSDLAAAGFELEAPASGPRPLLGKVFCITGRLSRPRAEVVSRIQELGGVARVKPSRKCDYFVAGGDPAEDKVAEFEKLKTDGKSAIRELSEEELERLLRGEDP